ncbi:hypothetical protein E2C01_090962 [Portunus trituberculatus]|uniref:Uncharacterized protein n=1 Tax=Portunus trituberculatus TaxID=210409 RepID=A0A5B7JRI8_PORTR|nr:hypothetical protein [Portunus trituberculatus]
MVRVQGHLSGVVRGGSWWRPRRPDVTYLVTLLAACSHCPVCLATRTGSRLGVHDAISSLRPMLQCNYSFMSHLAGSGPFSICLKGGRRKHIK